MVESPKSGRELKGSRSPNGYFGPRLRRWFNRTFRDLDNSQEER